MLQFVKRLLSHLQGETLKLFGLAGILLLIWGTLAPIGTLVWWVSQSAESLGLKEEEEQKRLRSSNSASQGATGSANSKAANSKIDCYIVYLSGVGDFSTDQLLSGEKFFLDQLEQLHPNCVTVRDVFPYSAANESLGGQRLLAPLWEAIEEADGWLKNADVLIKIRNLWRFAIAADDRYGEVYGRGIATAIVDRMNAVHPVSSSPRQPINLILLGTSGGVQVALGAVPYLHDRLPARLTVVSLGGTFDGEAGFETADEVYQLKGDNDWVPILPRVVFASRWRWTIGSPFNQARQQGRYHFLESGPHEHDGDQGYFGVENINGTETTYVGLTLQKVNQLPIWSRNEKTTTP
ncbi:hypothetical protein [Myxacorys almedinensis]|uniref:Uncharacterized protein n=1 Tax=Myxacorys almedinensis A TaxID=2690445 RepID=A0A8J7Z374_9CYAN|nr:hypothetical protein [Myxacorys almedinensis]NDJ17288.1 hypothetical protein [Myxacorys almedinensis A]